MTLFMPLSCPHCGAEAGRFDFGPINVDGKRKTGRSQWPCGFNYEIMLKLENKPDGTQDWVQREYTYHKCGRVR